MIKVINFGVYGHSHFQANMVILHLMNADPTNPCAI